MRVKASVWWPCISSEVKQYVENCQECAKESRQQKAPLIPTPLPDYPWQQIGTDLFELGGQHYLLVVDYFSRYPEVIKLTSTTSATVITILKLIFSRHGIPEIVRSDNGPQFTSNEFTQFARTYGFRQVTSSPHYPQSNGAVERMVQTVKGMLKRSSDPHLAILAYRATPMPWCGLSPSELCMGRRLRTTVPQTKQQLIPTWPYLTRFRAANAELKAKQKNFDRRHRVREPSEIQDDAEVWVRTDGHTVGGRIVGPAGTPRSYIVETPAGEVCRNQDHLTVVPPTPQSSDDDTSQPVNERSAQPNSESDYDAIESRSDNTSPDTVWTLRGRCGMTELLRILIVAIYSAVLCNVLS